MRVIVGRDAELRRIDELAVHVRAEGTGAVALVSGATGIGKTTLARQVGTVAAAQGLWVLEGRADRLNQNLPYSPLVEAFRGGLSRLAEAEARALLGRLPPLAGLFPGLGIPDPEPLADPGLDRARLFEAVLRLVDRMSRRRPLLLLLDDLHWFDSASRQLMAYLGRDLPELPVLLVATYRTEEAEASDQLLALLRTLRGTAVSVDVRLPPLDADAVGELARRRLGGEPPPGLADLLVARSAGVPLFAELLLDSFLDAGSLVRRRGAWELSGDRDVPLPDLLRDAVAERLARVPARQHRLLELLAVGGARIPEEVLVRVAGEGDREELRRGLADLVDRGLVSETSDSEVQYGVAHPLDLEVLHERLPPRERRRLHARFAAVWQQWAPGEVERYALHARRALPEIDALTALEASCAAGRSTLERFANTEAADHLSAAVDLARQHDPGLLPDLLATLGEAHLRTGDLVLACEAWQEAADEYERRGNRVEAAVAHARLAEALVDWGDLARGRFHIDAALGLLQDVGPSERMVELLGLAVQAAYLRGDVEEMTRMSGQATAMAARVGTARAHDLALGSSAPLVLLRGDYDTARLLAASHIERSQHDDPRAAVRRYSLPAVLAAFRGDLPALAEHNRRAWVEARRVGIPAAAFRLHFLSFVESFCSGDWDRAQEVLEEAERAAWVDTSPRMSLFATAMGVYLHSHRGDLVAAEDSRARLDQALRRRLYPADQATFDSFFRAVVAVERGDPHEAVAALGARRVDPPYLLVPPAWIATVEGVALAGAGSPDQARRCARRLGARSDPGSYQAVAADRIVGHADVAEGRHDKAVARLRDALSGFTALGMPFEAARAGLEAAEVARRSSFGPAGAAEGEVGAYRRLFDQLGARRYAERAARLLGDSGEADVGSPELTARQMEVARLVARGLSNAEVADELYVSVRTVTSHLDRIYTRLGIGSRAALATYVARHSRQVLT